MWKVFSINRQDIWLGLLAISLFLALVPIITYAYFAKDITDEEKIMNRHNTGLILLDRNDRPFFTFYQAHSQDTIPLDSIPKYTQEAVIASEDKGFYNHPGFSIKAIARALVSDIHNQGIIYGGSTITQQLVKNALLTPRRDFLRKYQEIVLAEELERRFSKDRILSMYLNSVYFGSGAFGIEEAAQTYFGKSAKDLDLAQSSLLAAVLPAPSLLSPFSGDLSKAQTRQEYVLQKMVDQGYITKDQKKQATEERLNFKPQENDMNNIAVHFALMVRDQLIQKYGEENISRSGFKVKTTINLDWQKYAEGVVADQVKRLKPNNVSNGAAVVLDPKTGEIKAYVGSKDWNDREFGKVDIANSLRQPGSAFKPIVYSEALEKHLITPASVLKDEPTIYHIAGSPAYKPLDYDHKFRGQVLARRALANSLNVPSVQVMSMVGVPAALEMAHRLGITTLNDPSDYGLSLVLGAGEVKLLDLTEVYATFANNGQKVEPSAILEIKNKAGQVVYSYKSEPQQVLDPKVAFQISSILSDNNTRAEVFGNALNLSRPAAVKTGTTENYRDAWTMGYTPSLVVGVWVGNNNGKVMDNIAGSLGAAPIWQALMEEFLAGTPVEKFDRPEGIVQNYVCRSNGLLLKEGSASGYPEYFLPGTEPTNYCLVAQPPKPLISPTSAATPPISHSPSEKSG